MILVDTSVWSAHFRGGRRDLSMLLEQQQVLGHPFVIGELSCGRLPHRKQTLADLAQLPAAPVAVQDEVLELIERHRLMGAGLGWVDVHVLASSFLARAPLWTLDRALAAQARRLGVSAD